MVADYIPFVSGNDNAKLAGHVFPDATVYRVSLDRIAAIRSNLAKTNFWVDPGVDGFDDLNVRIPPPPKPDGSQWKNSWHDRVRKYSNYKQIGDPGFQQKPDTTLVEEFVDDVLDACASEKPAWITVPQLPYVDDASRNKINRALASATGAWRTRNGFRGKLILPIIFTTQNPINTGRRPRVELAEDCFARSSADGVWVVDSSLEEESCASTISDTRLPNLIHLHEELAEAIPNCLRIAGPYWGINILLWAKGLVDHPAISVGTGYSYSVSGGQMKQGSVRLAIPPLRRRVKAATSHFGKWIHDAMKKIPSSDPRFAEMLALQQALPQFRLNEDRAKRQVAEFYRRWFDLISVHPKAGRAMALFQDLSSAYAFGSHLPPLPDEVGSALARKPGSAAQCLMLHCL